MVYTILTQSHKVTNKQGRIEGRGGPRGCRPKRGPLAKKFQFFRIFFFIFTFWAIFVKHFSLFSSKNVTFLGIYPKIEIVAISRVQSVPADKTFRNLVSPPLTRNRAQGQRTL